jgi:hypothetical protein
VTDPRSAFNWRNNPRPSIFSSDSRFTAGAKSGKAMTQIASESVVKITAKTGRNPGSIRRLSAKGDRLIDESARKRESR